MTEAERDNLDLALNRTLERAIAAYAATRGYDRATTLGALLAAACEPGLNPNYDTTIAVILEFHPAATRKYLAERIEGAIEADAAEERERAQRQQAEAVS